VTRFLYLLLVVAAICVGTLWAADFGYGPIVVTREYESKVVLRFGEAVDVLTEPGLSYRLPLLDEVHTYEKQLQYLNAEPVEIPARGEKIIVDFYAVWRITDPLAFYRRFRGGTAAGAMAAAQKRIGAKLNTAVGDTVSSLTVAELLQRAEELEDLPRTTSEELVSEGVQIVDVRLNRTELPRGVEPVAYEQMREQWRKVARDQRARGERQAREIRALAEREARTTLARAHSESEVARGEGDAEAAATYAAAYGEDPEFYAFVRSLEAYRKTLKEGTTMVLAPDHEFFRYLQPGAPPLAPAP